MKAKYLVIIGLLFLLSFIVYRMMKFEESLRKERIIEVKIEDENKPLINELYRERLKEFANRADYYFITSGDYFEVLSKKIEYGENINKWEKIFLKGVNLGVAMPGRFPSEFSLTFDEYLEWFILIGEMNANVIRVYTILPPEFYEAFAFYNLHYHNKKLYLLQGVWAKKPEKRDYFNPKFQREFKKEIINVIDLMHGRAVISKKPGNAHGTYVSDISRYVIGIILGREWEPKAVTHTNNKHKLSDYTGNFISICNGSAMEVWLARMMDFTVLYETQTYKSQRPISFVNWLPLDPMYHSSEFIENDKIREYDNDLESIDSRKFNSSELFYPGIFASYHAYPYYPDYIYLDEKYVKCKNLDGKEDNYFGYLLKLKEYHKSIPLVIAEYGLPSSRGNSHYSPFGFHQGGHNEYEQAALSVQLTKDIHQTNCAGAIFFEWIDEWFKFNWLVMDFESPKERRKYWHNMENPEQNFGIIAIENRSKTLDGNINDWKIDQSNDEFFLLSDADQAYFYLISKMPGFNFSKHNLYIAIDTYDKKKGEHKLEFLDDPCEYGIEFLLEFTSKEEAKILVDDKYSVFTDIYNNKIPVYSSKDNDNGVFSEQLLLSNRPRVTLTGDSIEGHLHNRSKLLHGNSDLPKYSNADWYWNEDSSIIEIRLTWHLLNVSDPSGMYVLDDIPNTPEIECTQTPGFNVLIFVTDKNNKLIKEFDKNGPYFCSWETWNNPEFYSRKKAIYKELQTTFLQLKPNLSAKDESKEVEEVFRICDFLHNKKAAISITFDNACYSQYEAAIPILEKYNIKASFGVISNWITEAPVQIAEKGGFKIKRMGVSQIKELINKGHYVAAQYLDADISKTNFKQYLYEIKSQKLYLEQKTGCNVYTYFLPDTQDGNLRYNNTEQVFLFSRNNIEKTNLIRTINFNSINSFSIQDSTRPDIKELQSIMDQNIGSWMVFQYHHIFSSNSKEYKMGNEMDREDFLLITPELFRRQIRLIRNTEYWIAPLAIVGKYLKEKKLSKIEFNQHKKLIFLNIRNSLDRELYNQPLTIEYTTSYKKMKIINNADEGIYNARNGKIYFNVYPNQEVTIEILD